MLIVTEYIGDEQNTNENWTIAWKNDWQPHEPHASPKTAKKNGDLEARTTSSYKDSRYSWIVMVVAFLSNLMSIGFSYAIGIYFAEFKDIFESNAGTTSLVSALNFGVVCLSGIQTK